MQIISNNKKFVANDLIPFLGISLFLGLLLPFSLYICGRKYREKREGKARIL